MGTSSEDPRFYTYDCNLFVPDGLYNWLRFLVLPISYGLAYVITRLFTADRAAAALVALMAMVLVGALFFIFIEPHRDEYLHSA